MGKTKTAFVAGVEGGEKSSEQRYKEKLEKRKKEAEEKPEKIRISGLKGGQKIKTIVSEPLPEEPTATTETAEEKKKAKRIKVRGKKYKDAKAKTDRNRFYKLPDAIKLIKDTSFSSFDGTIELHLVIKKTGFSTNVNLPYSFGKTKKIEVADDKTIEKLKANKIDFDVLLATADMMPKLVPFARILGPKGLMPNPKNGTLIKSAKDADKFSASAISIKTEKEHPVIHTVAGKVSLKDEEIGKNIETIFKAIDEKQIEKAYIKSTMSPSVKIQI